MANKRKRIFGEKINFKSLACAPINEQGVVYLFGVLHDAFDFKIESIQTGFPDCVARRKISKTRWEELRIEFEFKSDSFEKHKHDPNEVDVIICWEHTWKKCPDHIEVIELSPMIEVIEIISEENKNEKKLSKYNLFCQEKRLEGLSFSEIALQWRKKKTINKLKGEAKKQLTSWQIFCQQKRKEGLTFQEISKEWKSKKHNKKNAVDRK